MKYKLLLCTAAFAAFLFSGCSKNEKINPEAVAAAPVNSISGSSGLKLASVGDYGTYQIISGETNKSAEISALSLANGGTADAADYNGAGHQKWRITNVGGGYFTIMNLGSGKLLESYNYNGAQVLIQNSATGSDSQLWNLAANGDKKYKAVNKASKLAITSSGTGMVKLEAFADKPTQVWGYNTLPAAGYRDDAVVNFFHRKLLTQGSVAFDQGNSIPLTYGANNGKALWVAEDSFDGIRLKSATNANLQCGFFQYHNSVLIQPSLTDWNPDHTPNMTKNNSSENRPRQICDTQPGTDWSWPGPGIEINDKVYMVCGEGKDLGATNQSLYELTQNTAGTEWAVKRTLPAGMANQTEIGYSSGLVKPGDGYVYVYGTRGTFFNSANLHVARFPVTNAQDWSFWDGTTWSKTRSTANAAAVGSGQQNIAIGYLNGKYIMMQLDLGFFCDPSKHNIYVSTSTSPTGPFTKPVQVFTIEDRYRGHLNRYYTPAVHPEFDNGKKELLLTYSVNFAACSTGDDCANGQMESINYQVKGVRVPYSLIGL